MVIIDKFLQRRQDEGRPIRVGIVGAGVMARGVALQLLTCVPGMRLVVVSNRTLATAVRAYTDGGVNEDDISHVNTVPKLDDAISNGKFAVTEDALLVCQAECVDVIVEVTGAVEFGSHIAIAAFQNGKHFITMNAEMDGTVGAQLKRLADKAGVVYSVSDGDQPGVIMNLYRYVVGMGARPVLCGNIKGLHDPYRNPTTQEGFARKWNQNPYMVTSFADGTKISFEQALVANATGMSVLQRGMLGPTAPAGANSIHDAAQWFPEDRLLDQSPGYVDYVVGAIPAPGVFILATQDNPLQKYYLSLYKLGEGPLYVFYHPYHLCHLETQNSIARAALFGDTTLASAGGPKVDVVATAKTELRAGEILDGLGGYHAYGLAEKADITVRERLLPIGISEGCRLNKDIPKDQVISYDDVVLPEGRLVDRLRAEQTEFYWGDLNRV